jgi:hypothetical protein
MVDRDLHVLAVLRSTLLYFCGKGHHANAPQCYVSLTLPFLFYVLWSKEIIFISQMQCRYEVDNLKNNDWSVFA